MSNLLEKASIITTPTAYENGKLLSVKPNSGENLVLYSEDYSQSQWNKTNVTLSNASTSPFSGTATKLTSTTSSTYARTYINSVMSDSKYIISSVYLRSDTPFTASLRRRVDGNQVALENINVTSTWQRFSILTTTSGTTNDLHIFLNNNGISGTSVNGRTLEVIAVQMERGNAPSSYIKTNGSVVKNGDFDFSRGSSATRVNSQGLIEDVQIIGSDLVQNGDFSQEGPELVVNGSFDTDSNWGKGTGWSIANGQATHIEGVRSQLSQSINSLNGGDAVKVEVDVESTSGGNTRPLIGGLTTIPQTLISTSGTHIGYGIWGNQASKLFALDSFNNTNVVVNSVSLKQVGQNWTLGDNWHIGENKAIVTNSAAGQSAYQSILTVGKKYRVQFDILSISSGGVRIGIGTNFSSYFTTTGTHTFEGITVGDALMRINPQIGTTASVSNITVKEITDDTDIPRIDYTDGAGSILLEPQSTNLSETSEQWQQWGSDSVTSPAPNNNVAIAPDGTQTAWQFDINSNTDRLQRNIQITAGNDYSFSFFIKTSIGELTSFKNLGPYPNEAQNILFNGTTKRMEDFSGNIQTSWKVESYANDWYRVSRSWLNVTDSLFLYNAYPYYNSTLTRAYFWGAQLEENSFPTSYIPTVGSSVTRLGETLTNSGNADLFNDSEGVLYAEVSVNVSGGHRQITISDGNTSNRVMINTMGGNNNTIRGQVRISGATPFQFDFNSGDITQFHKVAIKYKQNDFAMWVDGVEVATDTSGNTPVGLDILNFNQAYTGNDFYGKTKCVAVFKEALSNDELECLTGEGYESFSALAQAFNYTII